MHFDAKRNFCDLHVYWNNGIAVMMAHLYIPVPFLSAIFFFVYLLMLTQS
jgi:hypothetical protein